MTRHHHTGPGKGAHSGRSHSGKAITQRQLRVGEVVRHVLADIFLRHGLQDPALQGADITVSEVRVSPDMRRASVFVARLGGGEMGEILEALARARGFLRARIGEALTTKFTPDLHFEEDRSFDEAQHIADLLHSPEVARDLQPKDQGDNVHLPSPRTERSADPGSRGVAEGPGSAKQHSMLHRARDDDEEKTDGTP